MQKTRDHVSLLLLIGSVLTISFIWLSLDKSFFTYDSYRHFLSSLRIYENLKNLSLHAYPPVIDVIQLHPSLVVALTAPFYFLLGVQQDAAVMASSLVFLPILVFSVYMLGKHCAGSRCGLFAAFLICMYPVVFNQLKVYMLDLPLTAMTAMAAWLLIESGLFRDLKRSLLFAVFCGLGLLTKESFLLFMAGPVLFAFFLRLKALRTDGDRPALLAWQFTLPLFLALTICSYYYISHGYRLVDKAVAGYVTTWSYPIPESGPLLWMSRGMLWYLWGFINWQASFPFFLLLLIALPFFARAKLACKGFLVFWIAAGWAAVSYFRPAVGYNMEITGIRYTMPLLPAVAVITAAGITQIPSRAWRRGLYAGAAVFGFAQMLLISFPLVKTPVLRLPLTVRGAVERHKLLPREILLLDTGIHAVSGSATSSYPVDFSEYRTAIEEIADILAASSPVPGDTVLVIPDDSLLWDLRFELYRYRVKLRVACDWNYLRAQMQREGMTPAFLVHTARYVIKKTGGFQGESYMQRFVNEAESAFTSDAGDFTLLANVPWPDTDGILVYQRKGAR